MEPEKKNTTFAVEDGKNGLEIKISGKKLNLTIFLIALPIFVFSLIAFGFIWGYQPFKSVVYLLFGVGSLIYILVQLLLFMFFTKGDIRATRFTCDWKGFGFLYHEPIALKYYRVILLVPAVLLGLVPAFHGFCTGYAECFMVGVFIMAASAGDCLFFWKLRHFDDNDRIKDGDKMFNATIIKGEK